MAKQYLNTIDAQLHIAYGVCDEVSSLDFLIEKIESLENDIYSFIEKMQGNGTLLRREI